MCYGEDIDETWAKFPSDMARNSQGLTAKFKSVQIPRPIQGLPRAALHYDFTLRDGSSSWSWLEFPGKWPWFQNSLLFDVHFVHMTQRDGIRSLLVDTLYACYLPQTRLSAVSQPRLAFGSIFHYAHFPDKNSLTCIGLTMGISSAQKWILIWINWACSVDLISLA